MLKKNIGRLEIVNFILTIIFIILSFFSVMETTKTSLGVWTEGLKNINTTISTNNTPLFMVLLGILQIVIILKHKYKLQKWAIAIAMICAIWTSTTYEVRQMIDSVIVNVNGNIMEGGCVVGGLYFTEYKITTIGYIVIILSWIIVALHIAILIKLKKERKTEISEKGGNEV